MTAAESKKIINKYIEINGNKWKCKEKNIDRERRN